MKEKSIRITRNDAIIFRSLLNAKIDQIEDNIHRFKSRQVSPNKISKEWLEWMNAQVKYKLELSDIVSYLNTKI